MRTTVAVVAMLIATTGWAVACEGAVPESVVECYSKAYSSRDVEALDALYADDYTWIVVAPPGAQVWDRETTMKSATKMFASEKVHHLALDFSDGYDVKESKSDGTWMVTSLEASLVTTFGEPAMTDTSRACATLYVRETETGAYEIFREVTFGSGGCDGWVGE